MHSTDTPGTPRPQVELISSDSNPLVQLPGCQTPQEPSDVTAE
jgi:hypothetical protein